MTLFWALLGIGAAYLAGGIPFGYLIGRRKFGVDIRTMGSGNVGATNLARQFGWKPWGFLCLALDMLKGFLPTLIVYHSISDETGALAGVAAVLGHMYPVWLKGRGGKGVATAAGVFIAICPIQLFYALLVFFIVGPVATRTISAGALAAAVVLWWLVMASYDGMMVWLAFFVSALVVYRHRSNLTRLYLGTENRVWAGRR